MKSNQEQFVMLLWTRENGGPWVVFSHVLTDYDPHAELQNAIALEYPVEMRPGMELLIISRPVVAVPAGLISERSHPSS
ncbi:MAG TPA: hypothetical protein VHB20_14530 [Verrucomicrobiae bacterium]|jgi:hypothetical protein|nr:hypothetical protein [Verrucomicrobiae bacterium]